MKPPLTAPLKGYLSVIFLNTSKGIIALLLTSLKIQEVKKSDDKFRNWVFTLNNPTEDDIDRLANPYEQLKYIAYGNEIAPETGTPHLQGFLCCWEPQRLSFFKKQIPRAHMEPMRGRLQDSKKYCEKEGKLTEWGQKPDQGRRTDIVGLKRKLMQGHHPKDLAIEDEGLYAKRYVTKHLVYMQKICV